MNNFKKLIFSTSYSPFLFNLLTLYLRLVLALIMIYHGFPKAFTKTEEMSSWFASKGMEPAYFVTLLAGYSEFFGGIAMIFGFLSRLFAFNLAIASYVHIVVSGDYKPFEFTFALVCMAMVVVFLGPGKYSLDRVFLKKYS